VEDHTIPGNIPLITSAGTRTTLAHYRGKDIVMANFLSLCQDECPLITGAFTALQRDVRAAGLGNKVVFMEITVDPGRDTPARLAAYSKEFGADWVMLTGTPANLDALWRFFGVSVQIVPEERRPHGRLLPDRLHGPRALQRLESAGPPRSSRQEAERIVERRRPEESRRSGRTKLDARPGAVVSQLAGRPKHPRDRVDLIRRDHG
jgi:SCO1/SenC family protein